MKSKKLTLELLVVYLAVLTWIIIFKMQFPGDAGLPHMRNVNLIPFGQSVIVNGRIEFSEIIQNVLVFIPYGLLMGILWEEKPFLVKFLPIVLTSFAFESIQYIGAVGASDITDLITNSLGGIIGLVIASVLPLIFRRKWRALINIICLIGFILLGVLSFLLFLAN